MAIEIVTQEQKLDMHFVACVVCSGRLIVCVDKLSKRFFGMCDRCKLHSPLVEEGLVKNGGRIYQV